MVKLKFDEKKKKWIELEKGSKEGIYYDGYLLQKLKNVKKIIKRNWDCLFLICGKERAGKSTLAKLCAYYLTDTKLNINNFAADSDDAVKKIKNGTDLLIFDEGSLSFSAVDTMNQKQRKLIKILNVIGKRRMIFIVVAPRFHVLKDYIAWQRPRFMINVYTDKNLQRGRFAYWGEKKLEALHKYAKTHFGSLKYPRADFYGRFYKFETTFEEEYNKLKESSAEAAINEENPSLTLKPEIRKWINQRNILIEFLREKKIMSLQKISDLMKLNGAPIERPAISIICKKFAKSPLKLPTQ